MIDVKETLNGANERMEMAAMYLEEQLARIRADVRMSQYSKG